MAPQTQRIVIRLYREQDRQSIETLFDEFQDDLVELDEFRRLRRRQEYGAAQMARTLRDVADRGRFLVADIGGEVAGFVVGVVRVTTPEDELEVIPTTRGRVDELYVRSSDRNTGIGRALMAEIEAWFQSEGCEVVNVEVFASNVRAREFYERLGYVPRDIDQIKVLTPEG